MSNYPPNRVLQHLPEFYKEILEFEEIDKVETGDLNELQNAIQSVLDNNFIDTMSVAIIRRYESFLGIIALPDETIQFRRDRILNRLQTKPPFTAKWLQEKLDALLGEGSSLVEVDGPNYTLYVTISIEDAPLFREFQHLIEVVKPANIIYQQKVALNNNLELVHNIKTYPIDYNYKLGSWSLGSLPFRSLGTEVIVK